MTEVSPISQGQYSFAANGLSSDTKSMADIYSTSNFYKPSFKPSAGEEDGLMTLESSDFESAVTSSYTYSQQKQIEKIKSDVEKIDKKIAQKKKSLKSAKEDSDKNRINNEIKSLERKRKTKARRYEYLQKQLEQNSKPADDGFPTDIVG